MRLSAYRRSIEKLYVDSVTIHRVVTFKDPVTKVTKTERQAIHRDMPCRISQRALPSNNQTDGGNLISYETKLFTSPDIELLQGDMLEVNRMGRTHKYLAGEPFTYPTHQELSIHREEWA